MNNLRLWLTFTTPGSELKALDATNNSGLWMTWTTLAQELKPLDTMNTLRLLLTWKTQSHKLMAFNNEQLRFVIEMNDSGSWAQGSRSYD